MRGQLAHAAQDRRDMARTEHPSQVAVVKPPPADMKGPQFDACPHLRLAEEIWVSPKKKAKTAKKTALKPVTKAVKEPVAA